jgi:hypothetical protein
VPIARYFIFVGSTLAALLFIPGWLLPNAPAAFADQSVGRDRAVIRIKSAHKWPEKVILDTNQPTITPPVAMDPPAIQSLISPPPNETPDPSSLAATALLRPDTQPAIIHHPSPQSKFHLARTARSRRATRGPVIHRRTVMGGDCCQFGWIDSGQISSNAMRPKRATSSWPY